MAGVLDAQKYHREITKSGYNVHLVFLLQSRVAHHHHFQLFRAPTAPPSNSASDTSQYGPPDLFMLQLSRIKFHCKLFNSHVRI